MWHLLLLITICFICLPVAASGTGSSLYLPSSNGQAQQYLLVNYNQFGYPTTTTGQTGYGNNTNQIRVNLNTRTAQYKTNHGVAPVGVVGVKIDSNLNGGIIEEYPPSNLWKLGIVPGDRVIAVEGQPVNFITFEDRCRGAVGQLRHLTIVHNGQARNITVPLVDARMMVQYNPGFQQSASMTAQW